MLFRRRHGTLKRISNGEFVVSQLLRLRTFGGIGLVDERGEPVPGALAQRRPLALVVIVATSGRQGVSREKLAGILWPDVSPARARHSLTQCLYAARQLFRTDDLFVVDGVIRLNPSRIWSDVGAFARAVEHGELEAAAELYAGPFLDGFCVPGSVEVDRWLAERRAVFEDQIVDSLDGLAEKAEASGELATAVIVRKRLTAMRPVDTPRVTKLIALLARMGHRAEAARYAEQHTTMLRSLDLPPDPAFLLIGDRVRTPAPSEPASPGTSADLSRITVSGRPRRFRVVIAAAATVVAIAIGGLMMRRGPAIAPQPTLQPLAVVPFDVSGVGEQMGYLGPAIAELLSPRLAVDSVIYRMDAGTVLGRWRTRFNGVSSIPRDSLIALGVDMGAKRLVVGTVSGGSSRVVVEAVLLALPGGTQVAAARAEGPPDSLTALAGSLAAELLIAEAGEDKRLAARWRTSFVALQRLVAGRLADRRGDYLAAVREYEAALAADSTLAPAALRLAIAADRAGNAELEADAVARAWAHRDVLDDAGRALLLAFAGTEYPRPSSSESQWQAWTALAARDARTPGGWLHLAARLFHEGDRLGRAGVADRATAAARRALVMDRDNKATRSLLRSIDARWRRADLDASPTDVRTMTEARAVAMMGMWTGKNIGATRRAIDVLEEQARTITETVDAVLAEHSWSLSQGSAADALAATGRLHDVRPDSHAYLRLRILDALYGNGDTTAARTAVRALTATVDVATDGWFPLERRRRAADGCVVAQWRLAHRDTAGVSRIVRFLRGQESRGYTSPVSATPTVCAELLEAALAAAAGGAQAMIRLARLDSLSLTTAVAGNAASYEHILIARLYRSLGHPRRALAAIRRRGYMLDWPTYLSTTWQEERELASQVGDITGALIAERALKALRSDPGD